MKYIYLTLVLLQCACAVELRDRHQKIEAPVTELVVENEYALPIPLIQSEQIVLRFDRLVLGPDSEFITQGLNVRLEVKELISDGGTIRTFKSDQIARPGSDGRRGGNIEIIVHRAVGHLHLVLQGEHGGRGLDGKAPDESLRGPQGSKGLDAIYQFSGNSTGPSWHRVRKANNGAPGGVGLPGFSGGSGFKGGDSGTALVKVSVAEEFTLSSHKVPGEGGAGGQGGVGGAGGFGGEPGIDKPPGFPRSYLQYTVVGGQGPQGPQGSAGESGPGGYEEKICLELAEAPLRCE